jgi:maltose alpha-D-glucosyltransferase/alpha-amylase
VKLDLARYVGIAPVELFGGTPFPKIEETPYLLTMSPHAIYWFSIPKSAAKPHRPAVLSLADVAELWTSRDWEFFFTDLGAPQLQSGLRRFFDREDVTGPWRNLRGVRVRDTFRVPYESTAAHVVVVDVEFDRGTLETRVLSLAYATTDEVAQWPASGGPRVIARISGPQSGVLFDAMAVAGFRDAILSAVAKGQRIVGQEGDELVAWRSPRFAELRGPADEALPSTLNRTQQAHRSVRFGNALVLKGYRRVEEGPHPEIEVGRLFATGPAPTFIAPLAGAIEYRRRGREPMTVAVVHGFIPHEGSAWQTALDQLSVFFERAAAMPAPENGRLPPLRRRLSETIDPPPPATFELIHGSLEFARQLGSRLGELHLTLGAAIDRPEFAPEPVSLQYQRSVYQSLRNMLFDVLDHLSRERSRIPEELLERASQIPDLQPALLDEFRAIADLRIHATRIRIHGDCRLDQILSTGRDFAFLDFEGRPGQPLGDRRIKRSPLRDVVGLVRSFDYAAEATLLGLVSTRGKATGVIRNEDRAALTPWAKAWRRWVHDALFTGYFATVGDAEFIPQDLGERNMIFRVMLLEKLLYELLGELRNRPHWLAIPLDGLAEAMQSSPVTP